jgi:antitoxin VapB
MTATAKIFMHGRSQAVRLPKEFRMPGTEVLVSRQGDKVILEPVKQSPFDPETWLAKLESYHDTAFPERDMDLLVEPDDAIRFD